MRCIFWHGKVLLAAGEEVDDGDLLRAIMSGSEDAMLVRCAGARESTSGTQTQATRATSMIFQAVE